MAEAKVSTAGAANTLRFMLLSPSEKGLLSTLVDGLNAVAMSCACAEERWRRLMSEGKMPEPPTSIHSHADDFTLTFLLLMILLTDVRRRPSTRFPYIAAAHLRPLINVKVAEVIDDLFLVHLHQVGSTKYEKEIAGARSELVSALSSLGTLGVNCIHELYHTFSFESDEVKVALLQALALHCEPHSPTVIDIALEISDPAVTVREAAMAALRQLGRAPDVASMLIPQLQQSRATVLKALRVIVHLGFEAAPTVGHVVAVLQDASAENVIREHAARTLGELGPGVASAAIPFLREAAELDRCRRTRNVAKESLQLLAPCQSC